jgi:hypothetical protein
MKITINVPNTEDIKGLKDYLEKEAKSFVEGQSEWEGEKRHAFLRKMI